MTGIERLRELAELRVVENRESVTLRTELRSIADQIEREQDKVAMTDWETVRKVSADMADRVFMSATIDELLRDWSRKLDDATDGHVASDSHEARAPFSRMRILAVVTDMERHVLGHEGMEDSPVARWARELREALGRHCRDGEGDSVAGSPYNGLPDEDREAVAWVRGHGGLDEVRRSCQDAENRRVELCSALGIGTGSGWADAMSLLLQRLLPKGHHLLEDHDGEPIVPGDARFGRSDGKRWVIDAVGHDFVWSGLSQTARKRGERPVRLRPEWLTKERPAPKVTAGDGRPLVVGEFVWHKSGVVGGVVESVDAASLMHTVRYRSRRGEEYRDAARDLVHDFPDSWERWVEDSKLHPSKYVDRYRVGRIGYEELDMNRDLVRRARALAERGQ